MCNISKIMQYKGESVCHNKCATLVKLSNTAWSVCHNECATLVKVYNTAWSICHNKCTTLKLCNTAACAC